MGDHAGDGARPEAAGGDYVRGYRAVLAAAEAAVRGGTWEVLVAQPGGGVPGDKAAAILQAHLDARRRGVRLRLIYRHSARHSQATVAYVERVAAAGAQARTRVESFDPLVIVDRREALLSASDDHACAVRVREAATVRFLVNLFESAWQTADPFTPFTAGPVSTPVHEHIVRLLREGVTGSSIAKRLGISKRTYDKHVAEIKQRYQALSMFELGYRIGAAEPRRAAPDADPGTAEGPSAAR